jgi:hypothetical protein
MRYNMALSLRGARNDILSPVNLLYGISIRQSKLCSYLRVVAAKLALPNLLITFSAIFIFFSSVSYAAEDKKDLKHYPPPEEYQKSYTNTKGPPAIPPSPSNLSPITSPQIAAPPVQPVSITVPQPAPPSSVLNPPSMPAHIPGPPPSPVYMEVPQVPIIGNTIGDVLNKGTDRNGILWIEVMDRLFGQEIRIEIRNLKNTPIVKQAGIMRFEDIKIGDIVNVIFRTEGDINIANFISIMTEEEYEMFTGLEPSQANISEKADNKSENVGDNE